MFVFCHGVYVMLLPTTSKTKKNIAGNDGCSHKQPFAMKKQKL